MRTTKGLRPCHQPLAVLGVAAVASILSTTDALATSSEIDSFDSAVTSQSKQAAIAFINEFSSSHLVDDLIELLRPEVAHEVCAALPSGATTAQDACQRLEVRFAVPQTASEEPEPIPSRESDVNIESVQPSTNDGATDFVASDTSIVPAAGPAAPTQALANTTSRTTDTTGDRSGQQPVMPLLSNLTKDSTESDNETQANKRASSPGEDPESAPKVHHDIVVNVPGLGSDPGSDPGGTSSPSSQGKDPGSDSGGNSSGDSDHDSHN